MSRVGKKLILIPEGVDVLATGGIIRVSGPKGSLTWAYPSQFDVVPEEKVVRIVPIADTKKISAARWGLMRATVQNMVSGVTEGFTKILEINGIGFKAVSEGNTLVLNVGFSHPVKFIIPEGIAIRVEKNVMTVSGIDRQLVGQVAANIRAIKKPEPYKGKGIKYSTEIVRRKVGKVMKTAG